MSKIINIFCDFSKHPSGRFYEDGPYSGQKFREEYLIPALKEHSKFTIKIDGVRGYGSSFLDEAFGGLVRKHGFSSSELHNRLVFTYDDELYGMYEKEIWSYIDASK